MALRPLTAATSRALPPSPLHPGLPAPTAALRITLGKQSRPTRRPTSASTLCRKPLPRPRHLPPPSCCLRSVASRAAVLRPTLASSAEGKPEANLRQTRAQPCPRPPLFLSRPSPPSYTPLTAESRRPHPSPTSSRRPLPQPDPLTDRFHSTAQLPHPLLTGPLLTPHPTVGRYPYRRCPPPSSSISAAALRLYSCSLSRSKTTADSP